MLPRLRSGPRRRAAAAAAALLALAACGGSDAPITLGLAIPLTDTEGQPDVYGENSRMGAELARAEINAAGGIGGRPLEFRTVNDRGDDSTAITVADSLGADRAVVAVVGHAYSGPTVRAAPRYEAWALPAVATSATSPEVSRAGDWIFRVASSDSANAVELARVARELGVPTGVLYANGDYGRDLMRSFTRALRAAGGEVVSEDPYLEEMPDFRPYLERMRRRGAGLVFVAGYDQGARTLIPQARALGLAAPFMGGDGLEALTDAGPQYDGTLVGVLFHPDAGEAARAFAEKYRARWKREPDSSAALAYDAVHLLARALRAGAHDRAALRRYLAGVGRPGGSPPFEGVAGPVAFDAHGDPVNKTFVVGRVQGGRITLAGGRRGAAAR